MPLATSSRPDVGRPTRQAQRARVAVSALFLTNGALFANVVPRYPGIKAELGLANTTYGLAVAAFPLGALLAGLGAAAIIRRWGSARVAVTGTVVTAVGTLAVGWSSSLVILALALFAAGCADSVTDVGQNTHGLRVQRRYGRSIINSFHAIWSVGAVLGGGMAAAAIALDVPRHVHLSTTAVVFSAVAVTASRFCLPGPDTGLDTPGRLPGQVGDGQVGDGQVGHGQVGDGQAVPPGAARVGRLVGPARRRLVAVLAALVVVSIAGTVVEDAGFTWAAVYLSTDLGAPGAIAAYGFIALVGAQTVGRLIGDRLVDRFGQRAVARCGGLVAAAGMGAALAFPSVPGTVAGFAAAGLGVATLIPAAMHEADELPGLRVGTGITVVTWLMRLGFLLSPPLVGMVADGIGLRTGLLVVPLAGVTVVLLSAVLSGRVRPRTTGPAAPR